MEPTQNCYSEHMPVGKFKGQHIRAVPLAYVLWCVGQYHFCRSRPLFVESCLRYLRERLEDLPAVMSEVIPKAGDDLPNYVRSPKVDAKRRKRKGKRIVAVEMTRRIEAIREIRPRPTGVSPKQGMPKTTAIDTQECPGRPNPDDICDLV